MIPVEQHADRTARLAAIAADLAALDQAWMALDEEFARVAAEVGRQHEAGVTAGQDLARLTDLGAALFQVQQTAIEVISTALPVVQEAANG